MLSWGGNWPQQNYCLHILHLPFLAVAVDDISDKCDQISDQISDQIKTVFQNDQGKKTIDVYWIADDGGELFYVIMKVSG